jgi:hypothetical protein
VGIDPHQRKRAGFESQTRDGRVTIRSQRGQNPRIHLPKALRYGLGAMLFQSTLRCIRGIVYANGSQNKSRPLQEVVLEIELIWTYLRMIYDFKGISQGEFQTLSERLSEITSQVNAWLKWEKGRAKAK